MLTRVLKTEGLQDCLRKRKTWAEAVMADLKGQHNLERAKFRGRWNMEIQAYLTAAARNLKKLARGSRKVNGGGGALASDFSEMVLDLLLRTRLISRLAQYFG